MRSFVFLIGMISLLLACSSSVVTDDGNFEKSSDESLKEESVVKQSNALAFELEEGEALLLGDSIQFLDVALNEITNIDLKEGDVVKLLGKSTALYNHTDDFCNSFHYISIALSNGDSAIVDGRNVYKLFYPLLDTVNANGNKIQLYNTEFYGIGVLYDDMLSNCGEYYQPIVLIDEAAEYKGFVQLEKNRLSKKLARDDFDYLEFLQDESESDEIQNVKLHGDKLTLKINRSFLEEERSFEIHLSKSIRSYSAIYK